MGVLRVNQQQGPPTPGNLLGAQIAPIGSFGTMATTRRSTNVDDSFDQSSQRGTNLDVNFPNAQLASMGSFDGNDNW